MSLAKYAYLLFCDDDNLLCDTYVRGLFDIMDSDSQIGACGGKGIELIRECEKPVWFDKFKHNYAVGSQGTNPLGLYGAGMCIRYSAIQHIREYGFIPFLTGRKGSILLAGDDSEITYALRISKYKLVACDDFYFWHILPLKRLSEQYLKNMAIGFGMSSPVTTTYKLFLDKRRVPSKYLLIFFLLVGSFKSFGYAFTQSGLKRRFFLNYAYGQIKGIKLFKNELPKIIEVVKSISN